MKKYNGWQHIHTRQSKEIMISLREAKEEPMALMLINDSGMGKTQTIQQFMLEQPQHTYLITVGASFKLGDIIDAIIECLGMTYESERRDIRKKLQLIAARLREIKMAGGNPILIIDEAENLFVTVLKMIKELYDAVIKYSSIVLIGTKQIIDVIHNRGSKNRTGVPQLWRRFKAGTRYISPLHKGKDFKAFFDTYIPHDEGLQTLLLNLANNYGELHDYLDTALRKAEKRGVVLDEKLFRLIHKIPAHAI